MMIRYGSARILKTAASLTGLVSPWQGGLVKKAGKQLETLDLDPENYIYLRNRAISALEMHGPNQNWDAFEYDELAKAYPSFIGKPVSVDHIGTDVIGLVLDSEFIPLPVFREELGLPMMPYEQMLDTLQVICSRSKDAFGKVLSYAGSKKLVRGSDQKQIVEAVAKHISCSGWVENVWAIEKRAAEAHKRGLCRAILAGEISDTSMGCMVERAVCSVCQNTATGELPEDEDFCKCIRLHKGRQTRLKDLIDADGLSADIMVIPFEINRLGDDAFFEDSLILPRKFGGKAGGEGADKDAKLLEVFSNKKTASKVAYIETNPNPQQSIRKTPDMYVMIGDMPQHVEENRDAFLAERQEEIQEHIDQQNAPGDVPEGTIILIKHEDAEVDAVVVEEHEDGELVVAIDGLDEPITIRNVDIIEVKEFSEDMDYENRMESTEYEMQPERRAAGLIANSN
jgi:hypothetical protein